MRVSALLAAVVVVPLWPQQSRYELPAEQRTGTIRRIYVVSHSHLDIGFTRPPDEVAREYKENIDAAIRLTRENPDFRWTIESAWMLEEWLRRTGDDALVEELGGMLREGRMGLGVTFANMHSGLMAAEESNRLVYLGQKFRQRFGIEGGVAFQNDVPGFSWAYPRILAGSGVKWLITGLNLFIGGGNSLGVGRNPFYWVGPDGSRVLTYFSYDSYVEGHRWRLSGRFGLSELEETLPRRLAWLERNGYRYDTYLLMASPGDNMHPEIAFRTLGRIREWNRKHPELPLRMATAEEFFRYLVEKYGDDFPSAAGDAAGHWEIVKLRAPEAAARMREASNTLPAAEAAATIGCLLRPAPFPRFDFLEAWYSLLSFHEHTADAGAGWPFYFSRRDADWSNIAHYAAAMSGFSNTEQQFRAALYRIAGEAPAMGRHPMNPDGTAAAILIYNGLSWRRGGPVRVEGLPAGLREGPLEITDVTSGERLLYEDVAGTRRHILVLAPEIPATGYRVLSVRKAQGAPAPPPEEFPLQIAWNASGWLTSVTDPAARREMPGVVPERPFGALFVARGREDFRLENSGPVQASVVTGPLTRRIELSRSGSALPAVVMTHYRRAPYADLRFDIDLDHLRDTGANVRYAVSLPLSGSRQTYVDGAGFLMRVPQDLLPGGGPAHYAPVHFAHYQVTPEWGVTVANRDSATLRPDGLWVVASEGRNAQTREEGLQRLDRTEPRSSPVQSFRFRVAFQDHDFAQWKRLGAEWNLPLRALVLPEAPSPPERSFLEVRHPGVWLLAFKPAEFRPGWHVARLQEVAGRTATGVKLVTAFPVAEVRRANLVEETVPGSIDLSNLTLQPWETVTVLLRLSVR